MAAGSDGKIRWRARIVTYGLVVVLAFGVWNHTEAWPVTSYRLFSGLRTGTTHGLVLVAVDPDGDETPVRPTGDTVATSAHRFRELPAMPEAEQLALVLTWLAEADIDPAGVEAVRLDRVTRELDPDGGPAEVVRRTTVHEVEL